MNFIIEFFLALFFILLFRVQQIFYPSLYFAFSDPFVRNESIGLKKWFFRLYIIIIYNVLSYLILDPFYQPNELLSLIIIGSFLGAFLILWPVIFQPKMNLVEGLSNKSYFLLYCIYISFLFFTIVVSFFSINTMNLFLKDLNIINIFSSNKETLVFEFILIPVISTIELILKKSYKESRNDDDKLLVYYQETDNTSNYEEPGIKLEKNPSFDYKTDKLILSVLFVSVINIVITLLNSVIKKKKD